MLKMWTKEYLPMVIAQVSYPNSFLFFGDKGSGKITKCYDIAKEKGLEIIFLDINNLVPLTDPKIYVCPDLVFSSPEIVTKVRWLSRCIQDGLLIVTSKIHHTCLEQDFLCFYFKKENQMVNPFDWKVFFNDLFKSSFETFSKHRKAFVENPELLNGLISQLKKFVSLNTFDAYKKRCMFEIAVGFKSINLNCNTEYTFDMLLFYLYISVRDKKNHSKILEKNWKVYD